jgi:hypothetical protein
MSRSQTHMLLGVVAGLALMRLQPTLPILEVDLPTLLQVSSPGLDDDPDRCLMRLT